MSDTILSFLAELEEKHRITILYAVECGSRSWGFNSDESDYDIRFVYIKQNKSEYMSVVSTLETIVTFSEDHKFDYQGWDLIKTVKHLQESNPSLLEWLYSPIVYINRSEFQQKFTSLVEQMHTQTSLMFHYYNMARKNWNDWIVNKDEIICKKYFHVVRPLVTLQYILDRSTDDKCKLIINFDELIETTRESLPIDVYEEIKNLIIMKRTMTADKLCKPIVVLNDWALSQFSKVEHLTKKTGDTTETEFKAQSLISIYKKLDNEFKKLVGLTSRNKFTDRCNYLSVIGLVLQFLWLVEHPTKETRSMPTKIHHLLTNVSIIPPDVRDEIAKIMTEKQEVEKDKYETINESEIYDLFIDPIVNFIKRYESIDDIAKSVHLSDSVKTGITGFKTKPPREDLIEHILKNVVDTLWLMGNSDGRPTNILHVGDTTCTISGELIGQIKTIITSLKPKYVVPANDVFHRWVRCVLDEHKETINKTHYNLTHIREVNTEKRFKKSLKTLSHEVFNELLRSF
jgi:hypothetical protein